MQLVFATHNEHKLRELQDILGCKTELLSLNDLNINEEIEETGCTLKENALIKAQFVYRRFRKDVFADDTGLEIDALNGEPGVFSARYAGDDKNAVKNMQKVINLMAGAKNRKARFKTVIALIVEGREYFFEGIVNGKILDAPAGNCGFGYDPVFMPDGYPCTFAQMDSETKNSISHRGKAVRQLIDFINKLPVQS
ncbi:MAG: non-canonical purine NTP diphosphatase [Cytophagaceae bacterium]|jgi:XTP/dITP diphosphohydrolase|nr:non-canonical purine NTP diphosphatase [Cytophagaceae bacterium]